MESFAEIINDLRIKNKNKWYFFNDSINGHSVEVKGFGTWLQIIKVDGVHCSGFTMYLKVKEFKDELKRVEKQFNLTF